MKQQDKGDGSGTTSTSLWLTKADLFLPVLVEDPGKAAAWRVGMLFRDGAYNLAMLLVKTEAIVCEYRKSGPDVAIREVTWVSFGNVCNQMALWSVFVTDALQAASSLSHRPLEIRDHAIYVERFRSR